MSAADTAEADRYAWERPGAFEVAPGVHRIPLPLPGDALKAVNVYAISDGAQVVLIDGGWALPESEELLAAGLGTIGYDLGDVREFLVTHMHRDHYGQAVAVRRRFGTKVSLGAGEQAAFEALAQLVHGRDRAQMRRLSEGGADELLAALDTEDLTVPPDYKDSPDQWLTDGVDVALDTRRLRVIATPGHTAGHVVFHDADHGALFAGDHVLPHITPSIGVEPVTTPSPLRSYLDSLRLVQELPDARLFPAHGPVTESVHARIDELLAHHENRLVVTAEAVDRGADTALAVARELTWTRRQRRLGELDLFNQILAVNETMAHLIVLVERGWLTEKTVDGVRHFARA
jgi:glyoxylase-like metal-dependent hydrolase (beta-lactamase superfamily II)